MREQKNASTRLKPISATLLTTKKEKSTGRGLAHGKEITGATHQTTCSGLNPQLLVTVVFGLCSPQILLISAMINGALWALIMSNGLRPSKTRYKT